MFNFFKKRSADEAPSYFMGWRVLTCQKGQNWLSLQIEPMKAAPCRVYVPTEGSWRSLAPAWARDVRAAILAGAKQVAWNRDLDWIETDRASFWPRHVNDPLNGSLESTQGGRWLESLRMFHPDTPKKFSRGECKQLWCAAAEKMALQASGRVTIDADEVVPGSVFQEVELPALKRNPGVTLHFVPGAVRKQPEDGGNTR